MSPVDGCQGGDNLSIRIETVNAFNQIIEYSGRLTSASQMNSHIRTCAARPMSLGIRPDSGLLVATKCRTASIRVLQNKIGCGPYQILTVVADGRSFGQHYPSVHRLESRACSTRILGQELRGARSVPLPPQGPQLGKILPTSGSDIALRTENPLTTSRLTPAALATA